MFSLLLRKCLKEATNDCEETKRLLQWSRRDIMVAWTRCRRVRREAEVFKGYLGSRQNLKDLFAFGR